MSSEDHVRAPAADVLTALAERAYAISSVGVRGTLGVPEAAATTHVADAAKDIA